MVAIEQMRSSNARIPECLPPGLVAVFVGGTGGIGESTMKQFARHAVLPRIYFIGRSERAAARITAELTTINPEGEYHFIRADLSLLQVVDGVCREIKDRERLINLLFLTTGTTLISKAPSETSESLYYATAVAYYARIRLIVNLLPLLQRAAALRRVVSVYGGTTEGPMCIGDLQGRSLPSATLGTPTAAPATTYNSALHLHGHTSSMMTLALESLALEAPDVSFVHSSAGSMPPGRGKGSGAASAMGLVKGVLHRVGMGPAAPAVSLAEGGERQLFVATSGRFPARGAADASDTAGVPMVDRRGRRDVARGSDGREGSGVYSVGYDGDAQGTKVEAVLQRLRDEDSVRRLWFHTVGEFLRVTGTEFV